MVLFPGYGSVELFIDLPMSGIDATITDHFVMFFGDMSNKPFYKFHNREGFLHILIIFMSIVMERDKVAVIVINPGGGNDRASKIAADILHNRFRVTLIGFGIDVESLFVFPITAGFDFFKGWTDSGLHFVKQGSAEGVAEESVVEMADVAPETVITVAAFGNEAVDVGIPF